MATLVGGVRVSKKGVKNQLCGVKVLIIYIKSIILSILLPTHRFSLIRLLTDDIKILLTLTLATDPFLPR
jgi:hypothetical protein